MAGINGTASLFEGSHYETENDYIVLLYYRNPHDRYDRVIGSVIANTLKQAGKLAIPVFFNSVLHIKSMF